MKKEVIVLLDNIRSAHNVGAIFRTADAMGVQKILLGGYTPAPIDRFGRARTDIAKAALGAEKTVLSESVQDTAGALLALRAKGFTIIALEQHARSVPLAGITTPEKIVLVVGNEVDGVSEPILAQSDTIAEIPMSGKKESLNVSVATGIALWELLGRVR